MATVNIRQRETENKNKSKEYKLLGSSRLGMVLNSAEILPEGTEVQNVNSVVNQIFPYGYGLPDMPLLETELGFALAV
jgi:hypothetical protein